jgi:4-amino-4-deoxy-L-arabinose transferase-like glycosyltransferase
MILDRNMFKKPGGKLVFAALNCFFGGATLAWLRLHRAPPWWDDAWYLTNSLRMFDTLVQDGALGYARKFLGVLGIKAPLMTVLPTPIYLILGRNFRYAFLVNLIFMPLLFLGVCSIARRYWNSRAGLIAVYVVGTICRSSTASRVGTWPSTP